MYLTASVIKNLVVSYLLFSRGFIYNHKTRWYGSCWERASEMGEDPSLLGQGVGPWSGLVPSAGHTLLVQLHDKVYTLACQQPWALAQHGT